MDDERAVLLGVVQEHQGVDDSSPYVCKAGGTPAWYGDAPADAQTLQCPKCGRHLFLVAQVYAPVESDRTLYVFGCNSVDCTETPGSWRVLRDQPTPIVAAPTPSADANAAPATTAPRALELAWGADGDDSDWSDDDSGGGNSSAAVASADDGVSSLSVLEQLLQQRDEAMKMPATASAPKKKAAAAARTTAAPGGPAKAFPAMPIDVIDEPFENYSAETDYSHENRLLEEYMRQEEADESEDVGNLRKVLDASKRKRAGGGGGGGAGGSLALGSGEAYEKTPAHQRHFLRFQKRISRCPLQCLRYDYGGEPLWPVPVPQSLVVPHCACGEARVFELQLTPTINYLLKVDAFAATPAPAVAAAASAAAEVRAAGGGMDWLSLLVYSCPRSCAQSGAEFIYVLPAGAS